MCARERLQKFYRSNFKLTGSDPLGLLHDHRLYVVYDGCRFTSARLLYDRLDEKLEWKHGRTFTPRGNKKLLCFVDDVNLAQVATLPPSPKFLITQLPLLDIIRSDVINAIFKQQLFRLSTR